jgi:hypothetical protein
VGKPIQIGRGFDRAYRLSRCRGFLVQTHEGKRIGTVSELHYRSRLDQPDELAVQRGLLGLQRLVYRADQVEAILWSEQRLVLIADAKAVPSSRLYAAPAP